MQPMRHALQHVGSQGGLATVTRRHRFTHKLTACFSQEKAVATLCIQVPLVATAAIALLSVPHKSYPTSSNKENEREVL
jgi:hypothetical protein